MGLFSEFEGIAPETWLAKVKEDLKTADFERTLVWQSPEGIPVQPFYHGSQSSQTDHPLFRANNSWLIVGRVEVDEPQDANQRALHLLKEGFQSICFDLKGKPLTGPVFEILVRDILMDVAPVQCINYSGVPEITTDFWERVNGCIWTDVLTNDYRFNRTDLAAFKQVRVKLNHASPICIDVTPYKNAGAHIVHELAITIGLLQEYFHQLEDITTVSAIHIRMAASGNFFFELAKHRAVRQLMRVVLSRHTSVDIPIFLQAEAASIHMTDRDVYNNLLRSTTAAMAAALGGCDALYLPPYDQDPSKRDAAIRWARNISVLLKQECKLDDVIDPANGSHYIEELTEELCMKAWVYFIRLEEAGGFLSKSGQGMIEADIQSDLEAQHKAVIHGKKVVIGVNAFAAEGTSVSPAVPGPETADRLEPQSIAEPFDALLRESHAALSKLDKQPAIILLGGGKPAVQAARKQFTSDFLLAGGLDCREIEVAADPSTLPSELRDADLLIICADDTARLAWLNMLDNMDVPVYVASHPRTVDETHRAKADGYLHKGCDMIQTLKDIQSLVFN